MKLQFNFTHWPVIPDRTLLENYPFLTRRVEIKTANLYGISREAIRAGFLTPLQ